MAPLTHLLIALAFSTAILASPHISRYSHAHRAVHHPIDVRVDSPSIPFTKRKRSINKRCIPRPSNSTSSALPSSTPPAPSSTAPLNVAPAPAPATPTPSPSPTPTPTPTPIPTPTPTPTPTPSSSSSAPPAQQSSPSSSSGEPSYLIGTQSGQGTYYATGLGACGITNTDGQHIAAVSHILFDSYPKYNGVNPNTNPVCNKQVIATRKYPRCHTCCLLLSFSSLDQGKSVTVTITDRCEACEVTDLDFSPSAFDILDDPSVGRIDITWLWV
ncbi:RlpA-like double-psi beta-barrel-protein domain-containing protein-containing protein [Boletus reticuloceps]|uniref:RlpA-like double-psi beta-barrel-protein domain-containing protein-containing protein n=1 Tax=Boletus reticuloceps TaxID=495285 RepID=A0A8I3ADA1_9AGAM|nr:RlpA-like double-psi beta-barrel-protein domain-containing protein-containing protein [Boletus reticuloceps]